MPYTTLDQLNDRYGERLLISLTDRDEIATGAVDQDTVDQAIADADALIDGYLKGRYQLPLSDVPAQVAAMSRAISIWNLHVYDAPKQIEAGYRDALGQLRDISKGLISLDVAGIEPKTASSQGVMTTDRERPLTEASLKGFI
ncbi:gp436 family protein [Phaeobacter sp. HF9A]|uniref:gp436 family protein n=1 Tax=Phaeobacter sp. HF9A TaxID=2721561 RepID=UPI001430F2ED|nr:DUF1320 domain-containing protein [Phaeobacter sp. HF9A]NIZ12903.1 DUF1320 domain-containing protein [Phaeobacter sp. HF9A]